jgi:hypothetical protein
MLNAHRAALQRAPAPRPFPSIQCNGLAALKRILGASDVVSATILSCISSELESGQLVLLGTAPWLHLHYGIVRLQGRHWTNAAETFRGYVLDAEHAAAEEEQRLVARFGHGRASARPR